MPGNIRLDGEIRVVTLEKRVLEKNENIAAENRILLDSSGILTLNLVSSPGSGKTTLLVETLQRLKPDIRCAVIEGDQQTSHDALRIAQTGVPVVQVNTDQSCHLNAQQVKQAFEQLPMDHIDLLIIENVGNLICPAAMDLGEDEKVALMSITEGEDKPVKYPLLFNRAHVLVLTKMDLLPYLRFDLEKCKSFARQVNPDLQIMETSSFTRQGLENWLDFLRRRVQEKKKRS